jgi:hypothetical protein
MGQCVFKTQDVWRCMAHALHATDWDMGWEKKELKPRPALLLVHDSGVYLMSNGMPRDAVEPERCYTAHAQHCNPAVDEEWWENSRDLVGGDDFVEVLPITLESLSDCDKFKEYVIEVTANEITASFRTPKEYTTA